MANATPREPGGFFEGLAQEHARIEARLKALEQAAHALGRDGNDTAALAVVVETLHFFATEAARHQDHEELTLFPRLRPLPEFKQIISAIQFQHRMNDATGLELRACVDRFAPARGRELQLLALRFVELNRMHAVSEERALFPLAASRLAPDVVAEMSREMRERESAATAPRAMKTSLGIQP